MIREQVTQRLNKVIMDNQYFGEDIVKIVQPVLANLDEIAVGS
jgi:hypothetical protein